MSQSAPNLTEKLARARVVPLIQADNREVALRIAGGASAIKAYLAVFRTMQFMPTGGISLSNLASYLEIPSVLACGGSWLTPSKAIQDGNFDQITTLAARPGPSPRVCQGI